MQNFDRYVDNTTGKVVAAVPHKNGFYKIFKVSRDARLIHFETVYPDLLKKYYTPLKDGLQAGSNAWAMQKLHEGKKVRRKDWAENEYLYQTLSHEYRKLNGEPFVFDRAYSDWQIHQNTPPCPSVILQHLYNGMPVLIRKSPCKAWQEATFSHFTVFSDRKLMFTAHFRGWELHGEDCIPLQGNEHLLAPQPF